MDHCTPLTPALHLLSHALTHRSINFAPFHPAPLNQSTAPQSNKRGQTTTEKSRDRATEPVRALTTLLVISSPCRDQPIGQSTTYLPAVKERAFHQPSQTPTSRGTAALAQKLHELRTEPTQLPYRRVLFSSQADITRRRTGAALAARDRRRPRQKADTETKDWTGHTGETSGNRNLEAEQQAWKREMQAGADELRRRKAEMRAQAEMGVKIVKVGGVVCSLASENILEMPLCARQVEPGADAGY